VYPDTRVENFIREHYLPVKIHVKEQPQMFERFGAQWTPTMQVLAPDGTKAHEWQGFLPADDFLAQLQLGIAHLAFKRGDWPQAERLFRRVVDELPQSDAAPEALYWAGVARYKGTNDASALGETAQAFRKRYSESTWAKKASVWAA
jgi:TolA-binding protein